MELVLDVLSWVAIVLGSAFCVVGGIGLLRLPDLFTRMHGAGITDTLGAGLVLTALMFQAGIGLTTVKLVLILFFLLVASPTSTHALAAAALSRGMELTLRRKEG